jgi:hypothetical protein
MEVSNSVVLEAILEVLNCHEELSSLELIILGQPLEIRSPRLLVIGTELSCPNTMRRAGQLWISNELPWVLDFDKSDFVTVGVFANNEVLDDVTLAGNEAILLNETGSSDHELVQDSVVQAHPYLVN